MWRIETIRHCAGSTYRYEEPVVRMLADETRFDRTYVHDSYIAAWREVIKIRIWWAQ